MAKSKAKKKREHQLRNSGRDVTQSRGLKPDFSTLERTTKTKNETMIKMEKKHKKRFLRNDGVHGESFFCLYLCR